MRRGAVGERLCDRPRCLLRWPCAVHGTLAVGDYEHLGRHAGAFAMANTHPEWELDMAWCRGCGYALCCCPASNPLPLRPGWERSQGGTYWYSGTAAAVQQKSNGHWYAYCPPHTTHPVVCETLEAAMLRAEELAGA